MEQTRPPEEFVSSRPPAPPASAWRVLAVALTLVLVLVLAAGLWARWRSLSNDDAARLGARATVASVRTGLRPDPSVLPDAVLADQEAAFGPAATPSQARHLEARGTGAPPGSLADAAAWLEDVARTSPNGELAATAASVAASWWAAEPPPAGADPTARRTEESEAGSGAGSPATSDESAGERDGDGPGSGAASKVPTEEGDGEDTDDDAASSCEPAQLAAVTALDRARFTAEAAAARIPADAAQRGTMDAVTDTLDATLREPAVTPMLSCDPAPVAGGHVLPAGFAEDPTRAVGGTLREASAALVSAVGASSPEDRDWLLTALLETAVAAQRLDPEHPVPALPGRD